MRKIVIRTFAGYVGTEGAEFVLVPDDMSNEELSDYAWQCGLLHAEMYGIYPSEYATEDDDEYEAGDKYSDSIEGWWEEYEPAKHDGLRVGDHESWNEI